MKHKTYKPNKVKKALTQKLLEQIDEILKDKQHELTTIPG